MEGARSDMTQVLCLKQTSVRDMCIEKLRIYNQPHPPQGILRGVHNLLRRPVSFRMGNVAGMDFSKISPPLQAPVFEKEGYQSKP